MTKQSPATTSAERYSPFFQDMRREMNQLFDRFRGQPMSSPADFFEAISSPLFPAIDVVENDDAIEITAEVPGVKEEDLDVSVSQNSVILKGEKSNDHEEEGQDFHLVERRYGSFRRHVPLGFTPDSDAVKATFADGVLKLTVAKPAEAKQAAHKIQINNA